MAQAQMINSMNVLIINAGGNDPDADGLVEPAFYDAGTITGGGVIPSTVGAPKTDPWGTSYAYCVWDHTDTGSPAGSPLSAKNDAGTGTDNILIGATDNTAEIVMALVSAGPNRAFEHQCGAFGDGGIEGLVTTGTTDDIVLQYNYDTASAAVTTGGGGLWEVGADTDEVVVKDSGNNETVRVDQEQGTIFVHDIVGIKGGGTDQLYIDADGGVGIGEPAPTTALHISGTTANTSRITLDRSGSGGQLFALNGIGLAATDDDTGVISFYTVTSSTPTERMQIANNGYVGIATGGTPSSKLHIAAVDSSSDGLTFENTAGEIFNQYFTNSAADSEFFLTYGGTGSADMRFQDDGDIILAAGTSGKVGIGTTDPAEGLHVKQGTAVSSPTIVRIQSDEAGVSVPGDVYAGIEFGVNGGENGIGSQEVGAYIKHIDTRSGTTSYEDGGLAFGTLDSNAVGPAEIMRITHNGKVGIGTTDPGATLHVDDPTSDQPVFVIGEINASTDDDTGLSFAPWSDGSVYIDAKMETGGILNFRYGEGAQSGTSNTWMTMDGGVVQIPGALHLPEDVRLYLGTNNDAELWFNGANTYLDNNFNGARIFLRGDDSSGTLQNMILADPDNYTYLYYNGTWKFRTESFGGRIQGQLYYASDARLKENIEGLNQENSLEKVSALQGVTYEWKDKKKYNKGTQYGVIAQDVQKIYPDLVYSDNDDGYLTVNYDGLIAPLIESIKELKARNESLQRRIEALESKK